MSSIKIRVVHYMPQKHMTIKITQGTGIDGGITKRRYVERDSITRVRISLLIDTIANFENFGQHVSVSAGDLTQ